MSRFREHAPRPSKREDNKTCDGTAQDYRRHVYRGEEICPESREAWRRMIRFYRYTGLYEDREPETVHPFMYRSAKPMNNKKDGQYTGHKNRSKNSKDPRDRA